MKKYIREKLIETYASCSVDNYGQVPKFELSVKRVFRDKPTYFAETKIVQYAEENDLFSVSKYAGVGGNYMAISKIIDPELKQATKDALKENERYKKSMTTW